MVRDSQYIQFYNIYSFKLVMKLFKYLKLHYICHYSRRGGGYNLGRKNKGVPIVKNLFINVTERSGERANSGVYSSPDWNRTTSVPKSVPRGGFG